MRAIGMQLGGKNARRISIFAFARLENHRAGAIAEQNAGRAIVPVENSTESFRTDHQRAARLTTAQHRSATPMA
jgi:hypothetical protein